MDHRVTDFLHFMFKPFFRSWWAALTGTASVVAFFVTRSDGVELSGSVFTVLLFVSLTVVFALLACVTQGWQLYVSRLTPFTVESFERNRDIPQGWVFVINTSGREVDIGTILDVHKKTGVAEVPLAAIQVIRRNSRGCFQAAPIGRLNPSHAHEHSAGGLRPTDLIVRPHIDLQRLKEVMGELAN